VILRTLARSLRLLALVLMATAALFGIPILLDPPPGDRVAECQEGEDWVGRRKRKPRR
jgi:hypothetical protein